MLETNLSIIASVSTILVSVFSIFIKQHSNNINQNIKGIIITLTASKSITYTENNTYNDINNLVKSQDNETEIIIMTSLFSVLLLLVSITIFIKYNYWIISFSCVFTLVVLHIYL